MNLNCLVKVNLEGIPFGQLNTSMECFEVGCPVVCLPGTKANNRFTYGFYKKIGLEKEYCCETVEEYIEKAIKIGTESTEEANKRREELRTKAEVLFEEKESVEDWKQIFKSL
jgi:predicted O-linked N-acetylglucosamine transferase (SPINDLY family)